MIVAPGIWGYTGTMRIRPTLLLVTTLLATPALAQKAFAQPPAYKECTDLAQSNPQAALAKAEEWLKIDDGFAAHHCRAMALYGLRQYPQAAEALDLVRSKILADNIALRTYVARQGAKAWVQAGRTDTALALLTTQIGDMTAGKFDNATEATLSAELLLDRAILLRNFGKTTEAVQDLDHAISLSPLNEKILLERALAFEQLNDPALAKQDAQAVLRLEPTNGPAADLMRRLKQ